MPHLPPHGGLWSVAGQQTGFGRQGVDLLADAAFQCGPVAAGQVGAADALAEDQVAAEADARFGAVEDHVPGRVTGSVAHFQRGCAQAQDLAVGQADCRIGAGVNFDLKPGRAA